MTELKPCWLSEHGYCHIEIIRTAAPQPQNIRIGCVAHGAWLQESFCTAEEAEDAWNRRTDDEGLH